MCVEDGWRRCSCRQKAGSRQGWAAAAATDRSGAAEKDPVRRGQSQTSGRRDSQGRTNSTDDTERYRRDSVCQQHGNTQGTAFSSHVFLETGEY
ncbi:uncharacterized [Lates japonicus]